MNNEMYQRGLENRRKVLGAEHVERSLSNADEFTRPIQDLVTEYCWGAVWGRKELDHRTRSIINLAMIACLNRPRELAVHVKGALTNGVTKEEIREILIQVAVYAGMPAGLDAFRVANEVISAT